MSFLNGLLLLGVAALAVPLLIHLLHRPRLRVVEWGAMQFLASAEPHHARRLQWQSWLLLLIRCLIPVVLAIGMARPVLTAFRAAGGEGSAAAVLVVDGSYSMEAPVANATPTEETAWQAAVARVKELTTQLSRGTQLALMIAGRSDDRPVGGSSLPAQRIHEELAQQVPSLPGWSPDVALGAALQVANELPQARRTVIVVSDFQQEAWEGLSQDRLAATRDAYARQTPPAQLVLLPVATTACDNVALHALIPVGSVVGQGEPCLFDVTIANGGSRAAEQARVVFEVDGAALASRVVDVPANSETRLQFSAQFERAGTTQAVFRLELPEVVGGFRDRIAGDNRQALELKVLAAQRVLLIEPREVAQAMEAKSAFFELALRAGATPEGDSWLRPERVTWDRVTETQIRESQVLVLAQVPQLTDAATGWIEQGVRDGKLLLVFSGPDVDGAWYNQRWATSRERALLPMRFGEWQTREGNAMARVQRPPYDHPALAYFNREEHGRLDRVEVRGWRTLTAWEPEVAEDQTAAAKEVTAAVMLSLQTGEPLWVERRVGRGLVVQSATTLNDEGTDWPLRPVYVPALQRLLTLAATPAVVIPAASPLRESNLKVLSREQMEQLAVRLGAKVATTSDEVLTWQRELQTGRELWRWLLMALVVFLLGEIVVQKSLSWGGR